METHPTALLSTRRLARNTVWNLLGQGVPMIAALFAVPPLVAALGPANFGIVSLFWLLVGYFSLADLGLGRATTQVVAARLGSDASEGIERTVWTAQCAMSALGVIGGVALWAATPLLVEHLLKIPATLTEESCRAFRILSFAIPAVTLSTGLRGVLEAKHHFGEVSLVRGFMGLSTFLAPLVAISISPTVVAVAASLVLTRWLACAAYVPFCLRAVPGLATFEVARQELPALVRLGSWITVSNIISPILVNVDRLLIGSVISMSAVAWYATPLELVTKLNIVPASLVANLFPIFAGATAARQPDRAAEVFERGLRYVLALLFPPVLLVVIFAHPLLSLWLGADFAVHSAPVLQVAAIGVLCNGLAYVPAALVQGSARPDLAAKLHIIELPIYGVILYFMAGHFGLAGVAAAWSLRVAADLILLCICSSSVLDHRVRWKPFVVTFSGAVAASILALVPHGAVFGAIAGILCTGVILRFVLLNERNSTAGLLWSSGKAPEGEHV